MRNFLKVIISIGAVLLLTATIVGYVAILFNTRIAGKYPNIDFATLLAILLAFLGLVGTGIYLWISRNIKEEVEVLVKKERTAARVEGLITKAYPLWILYYKHKDEIFLNAALTSAEMALEAAKGLDSKDHADIVYAAKNAWAYYLAEMKNNKREIDEFDKNKALKIKDELQDLIESGYVPKYGPFGRLYLNQWKETCAWVMYCFAETKEEKIKARRIIESLKEHISPDDFRELEQLYSID